MDPDTTKPHTEISAGLRKSDQLAGRVRFENCDRPTPTQGRHAKLKIIWMLWSLATFVAAGFPR
ncbi:hypothetical protein SAMN05443247_08855 [Bradyrhizobium erythrophlei]|nr:hypothetical protein SAMN05443247_08855 [Bradyrhizobium erythrophlei]